LPEITKKKKKQNLRRENISQSGESSKEINTKTRDEGSENINVVLVSYLNDAEVSLVGIREGVSDVMEKEAKGIENGESKVWFDMVVGLVGKSREFDSLNLLLELPVVNEGLLPFWYELSFKLF